MFYTWLHIAYAVLLCAAMWFNRGCWRMFILSLVVGAGVFVPAPWIYPTWIWYTKLIASETLVIVGAVLLKTPASPSVILFSILLIFGHLAGVIFGPSAGTGPYRITQPLLQAAELLVCIALSHSVLGMSKRRALRANFTRGDK